MAQNPYFLSVCGLFDDPKANEQLTFITNSDSKHTRTQTNKCQTHRESFVSSHYQTSRTQEQDFHTHTHFHKQKQKWRHQWAPFPTMMMTMMIIVIGEAAFGCCYEIIDFCGPKGGCRIIFAHVFAPLSMSRVPSINIGPVHAWSGVFPFGPTNQDGWLLHIDVAANDRIWLPSGNGSGIIAAMVRILMGDSWRML